MALLAVKHLISLDDWARISPTQKEVVAFALSIWPDEYMEITRFYDEMRRTKAELIAIGQRGTHGIDNDPLRATDARVKDLLEGEAEEVRDKVNEEFIYDPNRPGMVVAMIHGAPRHLHLQTHPNSRRRKV